jgi:hypothetical protein
MKVSKSLIFVSFLTKTFIYQIAITKIMSGVNELEVIKEALKESFDRIREDIISLKDENRELKERISQLENKKPDKLKEDFLRTFERKKKDLIKNKILELAGQNMTVPEIKDIVVDRENYCSKATFYRYIDRLKDRLGFIEVNEKKIIVKK